MFTRMPLAIALLVTISLGGCCCCKKCTKCIVERPTTTVRESAVRTSGPLAEESVQWDSEDLK